MAKSARYDVWIDGQETYVGLSEDDVIEICPDLMDNRTVIYNQVGYDKTSHFPIGAIRIEA